MSMAPLAVVVALVILAGVSFAQDKMYTFREEQTEGSFVGNVARDLNLAALIPPPVFSTLEYSIMNYGDGSNFRIDPQNSDLFTRNKLDREELCRFEASCILTLRVAARSERDIKRYTIAVNLTDINDNAPKFNQTSINLGIPESVTVGKRYSLPGALDDDGGSGNSIQSYAFIPSSTVFSVEYFQQIDGTSNVNLIVNSALDRETKDSYTLILVAKDGGSPIRSSSLVIRVQVEDDNDNTPRFPRSQYVVQIGENTGVGTAIITLTAVDDDIGANADVSYRLSARQDPSVMEQFEVNSETGQLKTKVPLPSGSYTIIMEAVDNGTPQRMNQTEVFINVIDNENNPPVITVDTLSADSHTAHISESANFSAVVAYVTVFDPDSGANGAVKCYSQSAFFDLLPRDDNDYMVVVAGSLNREETSGYTVTLFCEDSGNPRLNATQTFDVTVDDVNDNPPVFKTDHEEITVYEGNSVKDVAMLITATDIDAGDNAKIYYTLLNDSNGHFRIPIGSNVLECAKILDRETLDRHTVVLLAKDGGSPPRSATATVTVSVLDINDVTPKFFQSKYKFSIQEGLPAGSSVGSVSAFDLDLGEGGQFEFSLPEWTVGQRKFQMTENGTLVTLTKLDREGKSHYVFPVQATDNGRPRLSSQAEIQVEVTDINDNAPVFLFPSPTNHSVVLPLPDKTTESLLVLQVHDADSGKNGEVFYTLRPGNASRVFFVDSVTGELHTYQKLDSSDIGVYNLTLTATDRGTPPLSTTRNLIIEVKVNPELQPVKDSDTNAMIAIGLVCGTIVLAIIIVAIVCFVRRRDRGEKPKSINHISSPRVLDPSALPNQYDSHKADEPNNNFSLMAGPSGDISPTANKYSVPKLSVGFPGGFDQYNLQTQSDVRLSVNSMVKGDEPDTTDKELNRVTSLRLQQAFQHISSIKSRLITPSDTSKPVEWLEIHIPGHPGDFGSLSSRGTNNNNIDSGVGTDDDAVFHHHHTGSRGVSPSRHKHHHQHYHHHHHYGGSSGHHHHHHHHPRFSSQPPSDMSGDSSQPSCSSLPNLCLKPGSDMCVFRPLSARSCDSYPSETPEDQCTTTSGSYSIHMDDHGSGRGSLQLGDLGYIQDVYV